MRRIPAVLVAAIIVAGAAVALSAVAVSHRDNALVGSGPSMMTGDSPGVTGWRDGISGPMMGTLGSTTEADYLHEMVAHHEEGVTAARALARSDRPELRAFGATIVRAQSAQIRQMEGWLRDWYPNDDVDLGYHP